jgi:twitching motility protein PilT
VTGPSTGLRDAPWLDRWLDEHGSGLITFRRELHQNPELGYAEHRTTERLAGALQGIVAQRLLPRASGQGRVLAAEVLVGTGSVRESIKRPEGNPPLKELMEAGGSLYGMQTFEMHVKELVREGLVDREIGRGAIGY